MIIDRAGRFEREYNRALKELALEYIKGMETTYLYKFDSMFCDYAFLLGITLEEVEEYAFEKYGIKYSKGW